MGAADRTKHAFAFFFPIPHDGFRLVAGNAVFGRFSTKNKKPQLYNGYKVIRL